MTLLYTDTERFAVVLVTGGDTGSQARVSVVPAAGVEPSDAVAHDLLAHCETMLARYKLPRRLEFTDTMPRDPNGKLYKRTLRDPYWVGRERAI